MTLNVIVSGDGLRDRDEWLSKRDQLHLELPGGRLTVEYVDKSGDGEVLFVRMTWRPLRAGLMRFERP